MAPPWPNERWSQNAGSRQSRAVPGTTGDDTSTSRSPAPAPDQEQCTGPAASWESRAGNGPATGPSTDSQTVSRDSATDGLRRQTAPQTPPVPYAASSGAE